MRTGRRPKPTHLKLVTGNPGKRPLPAKEPKPATGRPMMPSHLNEEARAEWKRQVKHLDSLGLMCPIDRAALAAFCVVWSRHVEAETHLAKHGTIVRAPKTGVPMQNPFLSVSNNAMLLMDRYGQKFGFSPMDRTRLSTDATPKPPSEFFDD